MSIEKIIEELTPDFETVLQGIGKKFASGNSKGLGWFQTKVQRATLLGEMFKMSESDCKSHIVLGGLTEIKKVIDSKS